MWPGRRGSCRPQQWVGWLRRAMPPPAPLAHSHLPAAAWSTTTTPPAFLPYLESETKAVGDTTLKQEADLLRKLVAV